MRIFATQSPTHYKFQMDSKPILYTYGNIHIDVAALIPLLHRYNINCVVDCRPENNLRILQNTPSNELSATLRQHHIAYLPFFQHFGAFPPDTLNSSGEPVYRKVIKSDTFLKGIERLENGIGKGYTICIIDNQNDTEKSKRYTLIGEYLKESCNIIHLLPNGHYTTQSEVAQQIQEKENRQRHRNSTSQELGKTGELIAANYLTENGYRILDTNWNLHKGCELDIIAMKDFRIHFIEVKTRATDKFGEPEMAIDQKKLVNISKAIYTYRRERKLYNVEYQIDSIAIIYHNENDYTLNHFLDLRGSNQACAEVINYNPTGHNPSPPDGRGE